MAGPTQAPSAGVPIRLTSQLQAGATFYVSSGTVAGQFTAGTYQGGSLSVCGDSTHALAWSAGAFSCQLLSGGSGGGYSVEPATVTFNLAKGVTASTLSVTGAAGASVTYRIAVGSMTGAGLSTCGDSTHAIGWSSTNNLFTCQNVTGSGGGGGTSSLETIFGNVRSSPTPTIIANAPFTGLVSGATNYLGVDYSSFTMQGRITAASLGALTANQSITFTGDNTGSGTTAVTLTAASEQDNINTFGSSVTIKDSRGLFVRGPIYISTTGVASFISSNTVLGNGTTIYQNGSATFSGPLTASNLSGSNTGDQTITLTGDVTGSGAGSFATTAAATQGNITTFNSSITVRNSNGLYVGGPVYISTTGAATFISSNTILGNGTTIYQNGTAVFGKAISASNLSGTNTGDQTITLTGAVTGTGSGSFVTTYAGAIGTQVLPSTIAYLSSTNTWTAQQTYSNTVVISTTIGLGAANGVGTSGQFLTSQGAGTTPIWSAGNTGTITGVNGGTGLIGGGTSGVVSLALVSTVAYTSSTQTFTGGDTFSSPSGINITFGVVASSAVISSAAVNGQLTVSTLQGASLTTCGDASHGLSWTGGSFGCQSITGTAGGVVASASPTWTGVHNWANTQRSTFTVAPAISNITSLPLATDANGVIISTGVYQPDSKATETNKTLDAEGAGNTITIPFDITFKAGLCQASTATLGFSSYVSSGPAATCLQSTSTVTGAASFVDSSTNTVQDHFRLPADWTGNIDLQLVWTSSVTVGTVAWEARTACVSSGTLNAPTFNAYNTVNSVAVTQANAFNEASMTALTTTGCTANTEFYFEIARNGQAVVNDTHKATAQLITAMFTIRRAM